MGFSFAPVSGKKAPTNMPNTMAINTRKVRFWDKRFMENNNQIKRRFNPIKLEISSSIRGATWFRT